MDEITYIFVVTFYDSEDSYSTQRQTGFFKIEQAAELAIQTKGIISVLTVA